MMASCGDPGRGQSSFIVSIAGGDTADTACMRGIRELTLLAIGLVVVGLGATGCFVFDEIDQGQEVMRKHSRQGQEDASEGAEASEEGLNLAALKRSGTDRFGNIQERVEEAMKPERDPDDIVVRCRVEGNIQYMRKFSCQSLGGRVLSR
jgi:hypothetical protein